MALRRARSVVLAITGPRSLALGAPQRIGVTGLPPEAGCEVRMMCRRSMLKSPSSKTNHSGIARTLHKTSQAAGFATRIGNIDGEGITEYRIRNVDAVPAALAG